MNNLPVKQEAVLTVSPQEQINQASDMARLLKDVVSKAGLAKKLGGKKEHLEYEAWATIARWFNCTPITEWTRPIKDAEKIIGWEARVNVVNDEGRIIGTSEGMCMSDEANWRGKPTYALRSMAQTRTAGKALRSLFAHIAVLAGYSPTPAEEMDGINVKHDEPPPPPKPTKAEAPADAATAAQRGKLFALCTEQGWDRAKAKAFADFLLEMGGFEHFTKGYISECIEDFTQRAADFEVTTTETKPAV